MTILKYFFALFFLAIVVIVSVAGFRGSKFKNPPIELFPDMDHQPKVKAQSPSRFFADGRGARLPVAGTVPLGYSAPIADEATGEVVMMGGPYKKIHFTASPDYYNTGKIGDRWGTGMPMEITTQILERGRERFNISCKVCHGAVGLGNGVTTQYGLAAVANLHQDRIRTMSDGEIFNTITNGKNTMMGYGHNIQVEDRWAIIAYLRALQIAQNATVADVPPDALPLLDSPADAAPAPAVSEPAPASQPLSAISQ